MSPSNTNTNMGWLGNKTTNIESSNGNASPTRNRSAFMTTTKRSTPTIRIYILATKPLPVIGLYTGYQHRPTYEVFRIQKNLSKLYLLDRYLSSKDSQKYLILYTSPDSYNCIVGRT